MLVPAEAPSLVVIGGLRLVCWHVDTCSHAAGTQFLCHSCSGRLARGTILQSLPGHAHVQDTALVSKSYRPVVDARVVGIVMLLIALAAGCRQKPASLEPGTHR